MFDDVANLDCAFALARAVQDDGLAPGVVCLREQVQGLLDVAVQQRVEKADALHLGQFDAPHSVGAPEGEHVLLADVLADGQPLLLDAHHAAIEQRGPGSGGGLQLHLDLLAAGLVQHLGERRVAGQVDGVALEGLLDRILAGVADRADLAAVGVFDLQALEQVVDVLDRERQHDAIVAVDLALRWT